ncbi:hypothetical protein MRX96_009256 [Rhipicephalus microplus]
MNNASVASQMCIKNHVTGFVLCKKAFDTGFSCSAHHAIDHSSRKQGAQPSLLHDSAAIVQLLAVHCLRRHPKEQCELPLSETPSVRYTRRESAVGTGTRENPKSHETIKTVRAGTTKSPRMYGARPRQPDDVWLGLTSPGLTSPARLLSTGRPERSRMTN